ncbi:MAG: glycosyltransferase family 2 protein [Betaproteobacteria bacterium]|nr:glycosyltransferase family 2 protein [Betaproteobacteria bacterium]
MNPLCDDIVAVVVTYNPDETTLIASLNALLSQARTIVIVDNGSVAKVEIILQKLTSERLGALNFLPLKHNFGLGEALNAGIAQARKMPAAFVLLMDQDSIPEPGMLNELRSAHTKLRNQGIQVGAVGACYRSNTTGEFSQFTRVTQFGFSKSDCDRRIGYVRTDFLISSGSLISIPTLDRIGLMDKDLFIDHIDTEWCFRAQSKGFKLYGVCTAVMQHSLGERRVRLWFGRWRTIAYHQPFRYYYMFRNSVLLWQRPYMSAAWKRADKLRILLLFLFFTLFSSNRIVNLRMMLKGLNDGFNRRTGKL